MAPETGAVQETPILVGPSSVALRSVGGSGGSVECTVCYSSNSCPTVRANHYTDRAPETITGNTVAGNYPITVPNLRFLTNC